MSSCGCCMLAWAVASDHDAAPAAKDGLEMPSVLIVATSLISSSLVSLRRASASSLKPCSNSYSCPIKFRLGEMMERCLQTVKASVTEYKMGIRQ